MANVRCSGCNINLSIVPIESISMTKAGAFCKECSEIIIETQLCKYPSHDVYYKETGIHNGQKAYKLIIKQKEEVR